MGDDNVDAPQEPPPEAVEAEELQFGKNKKKKRAQESDSQMQVRCVPVDKKVAAAGNTLSCAGSWSYAGSWTQGLYAFCDYTSTPLLGGLLLSIPVLHTVHHGPHRSSTWTTWCP